jgi:hypothetical protein
VSPTKKCGRRLHDGDINIILNIMAIKSGELALDDARIVTKMSP